jgi:CRP-like cAMP-binding protein
MKRGVETSMRATALAPAIASSAIARLAALAPLSPPEIEALQEAERTRQCFMPQREIVAEGTPVDEAAILLSGWACRLHQFADGRRQVLSLLLPGDLIDMRRQRDPLAVTTVFALTDVVLCQAPDATGRAGLAEAYAVSSALEEAYLFRQIARLGRLSAYERIADWLLEIRDRLTAVGLADGGRLPMPLTQEVLADTLGLTSVHVNRTLQSLRRDGLVEWRGGAVRLIDQAALVALLDYRPVAVTRGRHAPMRLRDRAFVASCSADRGA